VSPSDGFDLTFINAFFAIVVLFLLYYCGSFFFFFFCLGGGGRVVGPFEVRGPSRASWLDHPYYALSNRLK